MLQILKLKITYFENKLIMLCKFWEIFPLTSTEVPVFLKKAPIQNTGRVVNTLVTY